jgi:hypothetical protein
MTKRLLLIVLLSASLTFSVAAVTAQDEPAEGARVRIGYFAFHPSEFDTFIDGEPASFGPWLAEIAGVDSSRGESSCWTWLHRSWRFRLGRTASPLRQLEKGWTPPSSAQRR